MPPSRFAPGRFCRWATAALAGSVLQACTREGGRPNGACGRKGPPTTNPRALIPKVISAMVQVDKPLPALSPLPPTGHRETATPCWTGFSAG
jgi:hypothetical protein